MHAVDGLDYALADGVATITLNRPEKLNAIRWEMVHGITDWVAEAGNDPEVRVIVITGAGRAFSSGDDIVGGMGDEYSREPADRLARATVRGAHYRLIKSLLSAPKPIVAALNGRCHGARLGHRAGQRLPGRPHRRADRRYPFRQGDLRQPGRRLDAAQADWRIAGYGPAHDRTGHRCCPRPSGTASSCGSGRPRPGDAELGAFVADLAAGPTRTFAAWKASVNRSVLMELDGYTDHENLLNAALIGNPDTLEGVASFKEKRAPHFTGG